MKCKKNRQKCFFLVQFKKKQLKKYKKSLDFLRLNKKIKKIYFFN